jgi:hypothetical protein
MKVKPFEKKILISKLEDYGSRREMQIQYDAEWNVIEITSMHIFGNGNGSGTTMRLQPEDIIALKKLLKNIEVINDV